jgi:hypothetical protein
VREGLAPVGSNQAALDQHVDVRRLVHRDHVGFQAADYRPSLLGRTTVRLVDRDIGAALLLPGGPESRVDVLVQLAGHIVGHVENGRLGKGRAGRQESKSGERTTQGFFQAMGHDLLRMFRSVGSSLRVIGQNPKE